MTTISHEPSRIERRRVPDYLISEMWASIAISVMWLAVLFDALFGPAIVTSTAGGDHTSVPSAVVVALFAFLGSWVVAKYGFRRDRED